MSDREEFEKKFQPPHDIQWCGRYYAPRFADDKFAVFTATVHNGMLEAWQAARAIDAQRIAELEAQVEILKHGLEVIRGAAKNAVNFGDLQFVAATSLNKFDALAAAKRKGE